MDSLLRKLVDSVSGCDPRFRDNFALGAVPILLNVCACMCLCACQFCGVCVCVCVCVCSVSVGL